MHCWGGGGRCIYISQQSVDVGKKMWYTHRPARSLLLFYILSCQQIPFKTKPKKQLIFEWTAPDHLFSSLPTMLNSNHEVPISCHLSGSEEKQKTLPRTFRYEEKGHEYLVSIISYNRRVSKCNSRGNDCISGECLHALDGIWGLCMSVNPRVCSWFFEGTSHPVRLVHVPGRKTRHWSVHRLNQPQ